MKKTYTISNKSIKDLLNQLDNAITMISKYKNKYEYNINIKRNSIGLWDAEIYVSNEKSEIKTIKAPIEPPTLL